MVRFLPLFLLLYAAATASAAPHVASQDVACAHCHQTPHTPKAEFNNCANCHSSESFRPSLFTVQQHAALSFALSGEHAEVPCSQCHVNGALRGLPTECAGCHIDRHRGILGQACKECHSVTGFTPVPSFLHAKTGFILMGRHDDLPCEMCHTGKRGEKLRQGRGPQCSTCHQPGHGDFGSDCTSCHGQGAGISFARARNTFDHRTTGFPLERRHTAQLCTTCHPKNKPKPLPRCESCHRSPHNGQLGGQCQDCHRPDRFTLIRFDHDLSTWPLRGAHFTTPCTSCHTSQRWLGLTTGCWDCHATDAARAPMSVDAHRFGRADCSDCHNAWKWTF